MKKHNDSIKNSEADEQLKRGKVEDIKNWKSSHTSNLRKILEKKSGKIIILISFILLMFNLSAIIESVVHPYISYYDIENLINGIITGTISFIMLLLLNSYFNSQQKSIMQDYALKESELWNKEIFEGSRDAIFIVDKNAQIVDVNQAATFLTGYSKNQLLKMSIEDLHEEKDLDAYKKFFKSIIGGESITSEAKILRKDGTKVETEFSNKQVIIKGVPYMHTVARDITERKLGELKLESLSNIVENSSNEIYVFDTSTLKFYYTNKRALTNLGYSKDELSTLTTFDIKPEFTLDTFLLMVKPLLSGEKDIISFETIHQRKDGTTYPVDVHLQLSDFEGKKSFTSIILDVTQRKRSEEILKKLNMAINNSNEVIFMTDKEGIITFINNQFTTMYGYAAEEVIEKTTPRILKSGIFTKEENEQFWNALLAKQNIPITQYVNKCKDGRLIDVEGSANPILDNNGEIIGFIGIQRDITERKKAELKLKENEQKYSELSTIMRLMSDTMPDLLWVKDLNNRYIFTNEAMCNKLLQAKNTSEPIGKTDLFFAKRERDSHPENPQWHTFGELCANSDIVTLKEMKQMQFDEYGNVKGEFLYLDVHKAPLFDDEGKLIGVVGSARDITDRKRAEKKLKETNEFNKSLIETIPYGLDIVDMEGNIIFINSLLKDAIGQENPKGHCWELYKDNKQQCTECPLKKKLKSGEINICEIHNVFGGREYEVTHTVMDYNEKKTLLEIFRDITEENKSKKEILKLSTGLEQSPAMVVITDIEGIIEYVNPKVTEITGYTKKELIGKNPRVFQSGKTPIETYQKLWGSIFDGEDWYGDILNKRKNGEEYWESVHISPVKNAKGDIINFISIKVDITEKIKSRQELIQAKEIAEHSNKVKDGFIANMSHEIRTPLNGIIGMTRLIKEAFADQATEDDLVLFDGAESASKRLIRTVEMILNFSRLQAGELKAEKEETDILNICKILTNEFNTAVKNKKLEFSFESKITDAKILADRHKINEAISNLIDNAIKYTNKGFVKLKLYNNTSNEILLDISDSGIGIEQDKIKFIFEPYMQEQMGYSRKYEGVGLGLSIVKKYIELNNFTISVSSIKNKGTTFTINFGKRK